MFRLKNLFFLLLPLFIFSLPIFSHGGSKNCDSECDSYYCPTEANKTNREES